jgi:hypothetical protein
MRGGQQEHRELSLRLLYSGGDVMVVMLGRREGSTPKESSKSSLIDIQFDIELN